MEYFGLIYPISATKRAVSKLFIISIYYIIFIIIFLNYIEARDNTNAIELVNMSDSTLLPNDLCGKWSDLADKVELLEDRMNNNFMDIAKSINSLKAKEGLNTELSREYVDSIVRENVKLRQDNENLRERSENLSYIISDLNTKAKRFEIEKESLITALGMLQSDLNEKYKGADWQTVKGSVIKNGSCKQMSASSIDADTNPNVEISNRFESLIYEGDEESDDQEIPNTTKTKEKLSLQQKGFGKNQMSESDDKAAQSKANKQRSQQINQEQKHKKNKNKKQKVKNNEQKVKENEQTREAHKASEEITAERQRTKETVVIAGDSIIKYVKGWEVSNTDRNVIVKSFSGATVNDIYFIFYFILLDLPTRAGSPQQHKPITVGPFYLTHPVNFPCGRKPEYPGKTHDFGRALTFYSFHMRTGFESDREPIVKAKCANHLATYFLKPTARKQPDKPLSMQAQTTYAIQVLKKLQRKLSS